MQADLLMEFNTIQKMAGENHGAQKSTLKSNSNSNQNNISDFDFDEKSFFEFVSMLIEKTSADSSEKRQTKRALEKIISEGESSAILFELLPRLDANKYSSGQNSEKGNLESLILFLQKMSLLQDNTNIPTKENPLENGLSIEDEESISALGEDGDKISNLFSDENKRLFSSPTTKNVNLSSDENKSILSSPTTKNLNASSDENKSILSSPTTKNLNTSSDGNNALNKITSEKNLQSTFQHQTSDENPDMSDNHDLKNKSGMKIMLSKDLQSADTGKIKIFAQNDITSQNYFEIKKEISKVINKVRGQKTNGDSGQMDNPLATSSKMNKNVSLVTNEISLSKSDINDKIAGINGGDEYKHSSESNRLSEGLNSKFEALIEDGNLNNRRDSEVKLTSDKVFSTVNETKSPPQTEHPKQTEIIKQIVDKMNLSSKKEHNKITIKLKPEVLGNIRLNISTVNHHVTIKVIADSSMVKEILENNLHHLKTGFVNQGLEIGSFDVMVDDQPESYNKEHHFSGFRRDRRQMAGQKKFTLDGDAEEELITDSVQPHHTKNTANDRIDYYV